MKAKYIFTGVSIVQGLNLAWVINSKSSLWLIVFTAIVFGWVLFFTFTRWVENR